MCASYDKAIILLIRKQESQKKKKKKRSQRINCAQDDLYIV